MIIPYFPNTDFYITKRDHFWGQKSIKNQLDWLGRGETIDNDKFLFGLENSGANLLWCLNLITWKKIIGAMGGVTQVTQEFQLNI